MISTFLSAIFALGASAAPIAPPDTLSLGEAIVVAQPKENLSLDRQPLAASTFTQEALERAQVHSIKHLSALAPSFYMPSYGSRLTSAVYIRGVGARIGTPAVGLYVDNVPFVDKSAYDTDVLTAVRVDVLRGPQGTLYGRGAMGGVVRVYTADPITTSGTDLSLTATSRNAGRRAAFSTFFHPSERAGISVSAFYEGDEGFFRNTFNGRKADASDAGGARVRFSLQASPKVKVDWTASFERSHEGACPYFLLAQGDTSLTQNRPSTYRRDLFNTGIGVEHRLRRCTLSSITAYQMLSDRLQMDQDYTSTDMYSFLQRQHGHTLSEEIALKSPQRHSRRWTWTTGVFGMLSWLRTTCPVTFWGEGVGFLNAQFAEVFERVSQSSASAPRMSLAFTGETLPFDASFRTPSANAAVFHESTVRLAPGLRATVGLRLDYERRTLHLASSAATQDGLIPYRFGIQMGPAPSQADLAADADFSGRIQRDSWQWLPKLGFTWDVDAGAEGDAEGSPLTFYAVVSKGYRSGGYNIQSYSDLSQSLVRRNVMQGVRAYSLAQIDALFDAMTGMPDAVREQARNAAKQGVTSNLDPMMPDAPSAASLYYRPEFTWNYEAGLHRSWLGRRLLLDGCFFLMTTHRLQLARFTESGFGRVTLNAGRSRSVGAEVALRGRFLGERLVWSASYGYTSARFTRYNLGDADCRGNRVPYVPEHTFSASAEWHQVLGGRNFTPHTSHFTLVVGADVASAGRIFWDEQNEWCEKFHATLGAHISLAMPCGLTLQVFGRNLGGARYQTFAFTSLSRKFAQYATPRHFGAEIRWRF